MAIQVVPYTAEWCDAVRAFNERMHATGTHWGWYGSSVDDWLPERAGHKTWREHWLAVEDGDTVRGAYALKPHEWWIRGEPRLVSDWQGPVTEGLIDRRYSALGLRLTREMLKQYPLLYSWGHGGLEQPMLRMLDKLGWTLHRTPFCVRIVRPFRFLRENRFLRSSPARGVALDLAAFLGAGSLAIRALHAWRGRAAASLAGVETEAFPAFADWADELWQRCKGEYAAIALRDAATMNLLIAPHRWPTATGLRIRRAGRTLGWAIVMDTPMRDDERFGSLRVGSIVDTLASPADAGTVVAATYRFLAARGVDLVVSNQAHPAWLDAFAATGFWLVPDRRVFAASPELVASLEPFADTAAGLHLTNMDGHGPMAL